MWLHRNKLKNKFQDPPLKRLKDTWLINYIDIIYQYHHIVYQALRITSTSYTLYWCCFFNLNNDVKSIISKHLSSDYKISTMLMSQHWDLQKSLFGEIRMSVCVCTHPLTHTHTGILCRSQGAVRWNADRLWPWPSPGLKLWVYWSWSSQGHNAFLFLCVYVLRCCYYNYFNNYYYIVHTGSGGENRSRKVTEILRSERPSVLTM